jgi:hypothetical protein
MTKTGYIGYLEPGSIIKCRSKYDRKIIEMRIENIVINPDDESVLIYFDRCIGGKKVIKNQCIGLKDLHRWFDEAKWTAVNVRK